MSRQVQRYDEKDIGRMVEDVSKRQGRYTKQEVIETLQDDIIGADEQTARQVVEDYSNRHEKQIRVRKPKVKSRSLENSVGSIVVNDLKKVGRGIAKGVGYGIGIPLGAGFAIPTLTRKCIDVDYDDCSESYRDVFQRASMSFFCIDALTAMFTYIYLFQHNPKLALALGLTQIGTNLASGIYEYVRHVRNRAYMKKK